MKLEHIATSSILALSISLSPAISQAKEQVSENVYQLVWNILIPTTQTILQQKEYQTYDCKNYNGVHIFFSDKKHIIPTDFFFHASDEMLQKIQNAPTCKV